MPTIPNPLEQRRRQAQPSATVAQNTAAGAMGEAAAQFGSLVSKLAEHEMDRINTSAAQNALNEFKATSAHLELDPAEGYASRKGDAWIVREGDKTLSDSYLERLTARQQEIEGRLTGAQRELFAEKASAEKLNFQSRLMRHQVTEAERYHLESDKGALATSEQMAGLYAFDPAKRDGEIKNGLEVFDRQITQHGRAPDMVRAEKAAWLSKVHTDVISRYLAEGDTAGAQAYFESAKKKGELLEAETVGSKVKQDTEEKQAMTLAGDLVGGVPENDPLDLQALYRKGEEALGKNASPALIKKFRTEVNTLSQVRRDTLAQRTAEPYNMILTGRTLAEVQRTPAWLALDTEGRNKVIQFAATEGRKEDSPIKMAAFYQLKLDSKKLTGMSEAEVVNYAIDKELGKGMADQLLTRRKELTDNKDVSMHLDMTVFDRAYMAATGDKPNTKDPDYLRRLDRAETAVQNKQNTLKRPLTRDEARAEIAIAIKDPEIERKWWFDKTIPVEEVTPENLSKVIVPEEARAVIIQRLKAAKPGETISESDIKALYYYSTR